MRIGGLAPLAVVAAVTLLPFPLVAEEGAVRADHSRVDRITITARRVAENLQDVPISVTAFSSEDLERSNIRRIDDLTPMLPSVELGSSGSGGPSASRALIRGIGTADFISTSDPRVPTYIDGIYMGRAQGPLMKLVDLERIEVLRGPQGTLFGRNTIGGAIQVVTAKPEPDLGGYVDLAYGNRDTFETKGVLNFPLVSDALFARLSFATQQRNGYSVNKAPGGNPINPARNRRAEAWDDNRLLAGRAALRWLISDRTTLDVTGDWARENQRVPAAECVFVDDPQSTALAPLIALTGFFDYRPSCDRAQASGVRRFENDNRHDSELDVWGANVTLSTELNESIALTSISAYRRVEWRRGFDVDATAERVAFTNDFPNQQDQFSQELNFNGSHFDGKLSWVGGAFYFWESASDDLEGAFLPGARFNCSFVPVPPLVPGVNDACDAFSVAPGTDLPVLMLNNLSTAFGSQDTTVALTSNFLDVKNYTFAGYGEVTASLDLLLPWWDLPDKTSVSIGLRRTVERKELDTHAGCNRDTVPQGFEMSTFNNLFGQPLPNPCLPLTRSVWDTKLSDRFSDWSPRVIVRHYLSDDIMAYGSYSQGYKSGGFNGRDLNSPVNQITFAPEDADAWELGLKASFLGDRLRTNLAVFRTSYDDIQRTVLLVDPSRPTVPITSIRNAAEATVKGFELEAEGVPMQGLTLRGTYSYVDAEYDEYDDQRALPSGSVVTIDRSKQRFAFVPRWKYSLGASYTTPAIDLGTLSFNVMWSAKARHNTGLETRDPVRRRINKQEKYGLLNARIAWLLPDQQTEIALYGTNLLDRDYFYASQDLASAGLGTMARNWGAPRLYGIQVRRYFGERI